MDHGIMCLSIRMNFMYGLLARKKNGKNKNFVPLDPWVPQSKILKLTWWPVYGIASLGVFFSSLNRNPFEWRKLGSEFLQIIFEIL